MELDKLPARPEPLPARFGDVFSQRFGQHHKGDTGDNIIHRFDPPLLEVPADIFRRIMDQRDTRIVKLGAKFIDKCVVDLKHEHLRVGVQPVEKMAGNSPIAGAQFQYHPGVFGIDFTRNAPAQKPGTSGHATGGLQIADAFAEKIDALNQRVSFLQKG